MAWKTQVVDRVPTYAGRVKMTPVSGQTNVYDLERADSPITEGTPINAALLNQKADKLVEGVTVYVSKSGSDITGTGASTAPFATIQAALNALPKNLGGFHAQIDIGAGTYNERVQIDGFTGGRLTLGVAGRDVVVSGISVWSSGLVRLNIPNITWATGQTGAMLYLGAGSQVAIMSNMVINGGGQSVIGISAEQGSSLVTAGTAVTVDSCASTAVAATTGAKIAFNRIAGSGNTAGALRADNGAVISYAVRTLEGTTLFTTSGGGRIFGGSQTNPAEY